MMQLSSLDALFLQLETAEMSMHVGSLNIYERAAASKGRFVTRLRAHMASRLPLAPPLRRRLWWMPLNLANPAWVDTEPDLRAHIVEVRLPASARQGDGMPELEAAVSELHSQLLDRSRPLWKMFVMEDLAPAANGCKRVAVYTQLHHAAVDGQAAVALAQAFLDLEPKGRELSLRPSTRRKVFEIGKVEMLRGAIAAEAVQVAHIVRRLPSTLGVLADAAGDALRRSGLLRRFGGNGAADDKAGASGSVGNLALAPRTMFNHNIGKGRAFAALSLPLDRLKAVGKAHDATLNDMVLFLCSTALRSYLARHGGVPRKSLIALVPMSLRAKGDTRSDTQATMSPVSLGTHLSDRRRRLAHIKAASTAMKATMGSLKTVLPTDLPSIGVPWLMEAMSALYGRARVAERIPPIANLTISNVPGVPVPLYLAGARMTCNYPTSIVTHGVGLNITVESYDKQMDFGLMADATAAPDIRALADAILAAFDELTLLDARHAAKAVAARPRAGVKNAAGTKANRRSTR